MPDPIGSTSSLRKDLAFCVVPLGRERGEEILAAYDRGVRAQKALRSIIGMLAGWNPTAEVLTIAEEALDRG